MSNVRIGQACTPDCGAENKSGRCRAAKAFSTRAMVAVSTHCRSSARVTRQCENTTAVRYPQTRDAWPPWIVMRSNTSRRHDPWTRGFEAA